MSHSLYNASASRFIPIQGFLVLDAGIFGLLKRKREAAERRGRTTCYDLAQNAVRFQPSIQLKPQFVPDICYTPLQRSDLHHSPKSIAAFPLKRVRNLIRAGQVILIKAGPLRRYKTRGQTNAMPLYSSELNPNKSDSWTRTEQDHGQERSKNKRRTRG
ncbi:hypothetical protein WMY93_002802 [Mugilogobius chulae]|uniref:Uncharacterized protein n=1 Tax=Mugilogobius chulae TaxID=88201 RepID=A0AAW0PUT6_9GOBI